MRFHITSSVQPITQFLKNVELGRFHFQLFIWMFSSQKQTPYFLLLQFYDAAKQAKKSLLKLTEHLQLDSKITLET